MVLQLLVEVQDVVDHAGLPLGLHVVERHLVQHPPGELDPLRLGQYALTRLDAGEHAVAVDHLRREAVVVQDLGLFPLGELAPCQGVADPRAGGSRWPSP